MLATSEHKKAYEFDEGLAYESKRAYFDSGRTKSYTFRLAQLKALKNMIQQNEQVIIQALYEDLHKPEFEAYTSEIGVLYEELNEAMKNLKKWMKPKRVATPLVLFPSHSTLYHEPLGVVLIIGPWNYPFQLLLAPLIGAIAAGNCALLKPSDQTPHVSDVIADLIKRTFASDYISVVQGPGAMLGPMLIEKFRFDHIFFTGSPEVGKKIASMAANHLTPVTLELGGKSPAIVDQTANLKVAARRLVWSKFFNAGQTCVCPDYLLVHHSVKDAFLEQLIIEIRRTFGDNPQQSSSYGRIVNGKRVKVLKGLIESSLQSGGRLLHGGRVMEEDRYIEPTLIDQVTLKWSIMQEEIFGPILPILTYDTPEEAVEMIRQNRYPLALYLYTESKASQRYFTETVEFGGGCVNNGMVHLVNSQLPFGGIGNSGMGNYHGKYSFDTFSHVKSMVHTQTWLDPALRYGPYNQKKVQLAKLFMR